MGTPGIWSDNLMRNFERITEWCDAIVVMCNISEPHYELYMRHRVIRIEDDALQSALQAHACNFGFLLEWITLGAQSINANPRLPLNSRIELPFDASDHQVTWDTHISVEKQDLHALKELAQTFAAHVRTKIQLFYDEMSDEYSSYSDYSEDTTTSEDEEEEVELSEK